MKLTGKAKFQKMLNTPAVRVYIVESYYGYDKSSKMDAGEFFPDEIKEAFKRHNLTSPIEETPREGLVIFFNSRLEKMTFLKTIVLECTKATLTSQETREYIELKAKGVL